MSDSSEDDETGGSQVSLTGFLFGNVDTKTGKLEDQSILGLDSDKQIKALENLGLGFESVLHEHDTTETDNGEGQSANKKKSVRLLSVYDSSDDDSDVSSGDRETEEHDAKNDPAKSASSTDVKATKDDNYEDVKSPTAEDFSDMTECIEDESDNMSELEYKTTFGRYLASADRWKMPPPPAPQTLNSEDELTLIMLDSGTEKKLDTPLASILPSKYAGVKVTTLFPDFRPDKVLRFSRLFGPGKYNSLPNTWKNVKKRRKKRLEKELAEKLANEASGVTPSHTSTNLDSTNSKSEMEYEDGDRSPDPSECVTDDEEIFLRPHDATKEGNEAAGTDPSKAKPTDKKHLWRHGPAAIWYEMLGVPDNPEHFEYGFTKKPDEKETDSDDDGSSDEETKEDAKPKVVYPDDSFNMVTQCDWEDFIIWDSQDAKTKKMVINKTAGWVPSGGNRSVQNLTKATDAILSPGVSSVKINAPSSSPIFSTPAPSTATKSSKSKAADESHAQTDDTWYSIFPVETTELVHGHWEKDIIWDVDNVEEIPEPKVLELDLNDENIILCVPDDTDANASQSTSTPVKVKIPHPHVKKSKILLGKAGVINVIEEDSPPPSPKDDDKDPYNLSLDEYYQAKHTEQSLIKISTSGNIIQHSTPVVELRPPFIPTHMNLSRLRNFHRPALRKLSNGTNCAPGPHNLFPLTKHIRKKAEQLEKERQAAGGGDIFFMRTPEDLSGKDGELLLFEYCEEHPPLLNQVGMCSKIKNYYKRKPGKEDLPKDKKYGETVNAHTSPFLGAMHPGQMIQTIENNMYRSAIFPHDIKPTDFLVIRTRNNFFVRGLDVFFTVAQECPLYEVPGPNSKRANNFVRDFLQVFIYRLFWNSRDNPRRIRMDDIKRAFPVHSESSIRKRLKLCADFKRTGADSNWWVIKPEFRLPTEEEIRAMVSPEQCCAYFSLVASEQRLKDAGYGTQSILAPLPEEEDENDEKKLDDEVKVAPWNTTKAYIQAIKGKCILQINGPADPTGCGEGFSYVRMPNKPQTTVEEKETQPKRIVTGTDADLRRLSLNNAKAILRKFKVPEDEIEKLTRWEVIDVVRTLSTEKSKAGEEGINKFSRGNRFSVAEHQERYKEECQRIFELQNRVLQSSEALSTDEGESTEEEDDIEDIEEMGKNIEKMLSNKKTSSQLSHEKEEAERRELQRMIMGEGKEEKDDDKNPRKKKKDQAKIDEDNKNLHGLSLHPGRVLKIQRTYKSADGKEFTRNEIVRKPHIIDIYMRIRTTKDEQFIRQFALLDDQTKEEMKKEKRRIQEQLRRIKKNQEKEHIPKVPTQRKKKIKMKPELKMKCGACGQVGHMRTNKACPYYEKNNESVPPVNVAMTLEEEVAMKKQLMDESEELVKVDGTKLQLSSKLIKHTEDVKRKSLLLKVPKEAVAGSSKMKRKRSMASEPHCDYLEGKSKTANRKRIDPQVVFSTILEDIINELRSHPDSTHFQFPVSAKVPRYHDVIKTPMDLQTIREKNRQKLYQTRADFFEDLKLLVDNSISFNGENDQLTANALKLFEVAETTLRANEAKIWKLEKQINPLLDENDKKRLAYILTQIIDKVKVIPEALVFLKPVNKKQVKNYYDVIKNPIDLESIENKIKAGRYLLSDQFLDDFQLLHSNANTFNGPEHSVTKRALYVLDFTRAMMKEFESTLAVLDENIRRNSYDEDFEEDSIKQEIRSVGGYMEESQGVSPMENEERPAKRTRRVLSYADEGSEDEYEEHIFKRSISEDEYGEVKIKMEEHEEKYSLNKSEFGNRPSAAASRDMSRSIHADLEVSDSNEEGEIVDDDD